MKKQIPPAAGSSLRDDSVTDSHPDLHSLINSLIDQNNKLKKENKNLRTLIPPDTKPIGFLESLTGSIKGSLTGGSIKGSVTGGSVKGSVTGGSIKGSVTGSQSRSSVKGGTVKGSENGSLKGSVKGSLSGGSVKGSGSAKGSAAVSLDMDPFAERILLYPKVIFQISIESIHNLECYITVWTKIKDKIAPIDSTETVKYDESLGIFKFAKTFEIPYLIGIDNDQMVIFEIFDGDTKQIRQGYFWAAVSIKLPYIVRAETVKLDIMRGEFYLGALHINPSLGSHEEKVSIKEAGTEKLLFFKSKKPSLESIRAAMPTMKQVFAFYNIAFKTGFICPVGKKLLGERGAIFLKLCTNRTNKEVGNNGDGEFKTNEFVYEETPTSRKLVTLWTSSLVTTPSYDVKVLEIKFSHEDITDNLDPRLPIDENANLIFQVYLDGIFNIPKLVHYATIPVQEFLNNCKPDRRKRPVPFKLFFNPVFDFKSLEKNVNEEKDEKGSVDSFEGEVNTMTQPVVLADDVEQGLDDFDRDNDNDPSKSMKSQKHDRKDPFIELIIKKEKHEFELTTGDLLYEKKLRESLVTKTSNWQYNLREAFFESWTEQAESIRNYKTLMEASADGWSLDVLVVADLHFACFQHMAYKLNPQLADVIPVDSTYLGSSVIDTIKLIYTIVAPLLRDNAIRSFAGGGVGAPHSNYPSCSSCRHVGNPLVQEYLISLSSNRFIWDNIKKRLGDNLKFNALCKTEDATENYIFSCQNIEDIREILDPPVPVDSDKDINPLIACLETGSQFESWGGYSYVETNEYYSWAHLYSGLLESTSLYLPCLAPPETSINDDAQSVRSNSKSVKSYKSAKSGVSAKSEKSGSTDRCTTNDLQNEILEKKRNKLRTGVSRCGILKPKAVGTELFEFIDDKFKMHSSVFDVDIEAINGFLLSRDKNEMTSKQSDVLIWALGKCPSDHSIEAVGAMIERHILSENKTALLIVLSAEDRFDLDDDDSANIEIISNPFRKFLEVYHGALTRALAVRAGDSMNATSKQKPKDNNDESKYSKLFHDGAYNLCLVHYVTFKEIMMRSFLDMDKTTANNLESATTASARSKKGKSEESADVLPTYGAVLNVLKLFLQDNHAEHIIGLDDIEDEDENEMTMESAKDIAIGSLTGSVIGSVMGSETGKPPTIDDIASNNSALGAKAKLLMENIDEQSEVLELKKKFDEERDEILTKGISNFVANFLNRMKSEKEIYEKNSFYNKSCMSNPEVLCPIT